MSGTGPISTPPISPPSSRTPSRACPLPGIAPALNRNSRRFPAGTIKALLVAYFRPVLASGVPAGPTEALLMAHFCSVLAAGVLDRPTEALLVADSQDFPHPFEGFEELKSHLNNIYPCPAIQ